MFGILTTLCRGKSLTAENVGNRVDLSRNRARKYLEYLRKEIEIGDRYREKDDWLPFQPKNKKPGRPPYKNKCTPPEPSEESDHRNRVLEAINDIEVEPDSINRYKEKESVPENMEKFLEFFTED